MGRPCPWKVACTGGKREVCLVPGRFDGEGLGEEVGVGARLDHSGHPHLGKHADFISRALGSCWRALSRLGQARFLLYSSCIGQSTRLSQHLIQSSELRITAPSDQRWVGLGVISQRGTDWPQCQDLGQ